MTAPPNPHRMTPEDRELVVSLRKTQWLLDDAAHHIPEGGISVAEHHQLADLLDHVSSLVRERARSAVTIEGTVA